MQPRGNALATGRPRPVVEMASRGTIRYAKAAGQVLCGCLGVAALTFVGLRLGFSAATVGFCYLILIESVAAFGSFIVCVAISVVTVGCLNYFFVPPLFTFRIDDVQDAVALAAFLITSIAIIALTTKLRTGAQTGEATQRGMIDTIPAMIWSALPNGSREFNNRRLLQYAGLSEKEAAGEGWATTLHPEDRPRVLHAWYRAIETGEPFEVEGRGRSATGEYRLFQMKAAPQRDERGNILKWYGRSIDIEGRKRDLEALRQSEEQWKAVFEHNPTMYFMVNADGSVRLCNDFGASQLGYTSEELIGRPVLDVFYPPDRDFVQSNFSSCLETPGRTKSWEARKVRKDGTIVWVRENAKAVERPADDVIVLIACEDISQRKQAEAALRASEERWRSVFETATVGIAVIDRLEQRFVTANSAFQRIVGYTETELQSLTAPDLRYEEDGASIQQLLDEMAAGVRRSYRIEQRCRRKDGAIIWIDVNASLIPATENTPAFLAAVVVDINDRKRAEEAVRLSEAYLTEIFETLPDGLAIVDRTYRYQRVNSAYERRTGLRPEQIAGMHVADLNGVKVFNEAIKPELDRCFAGEHVAYGQWFNYPCSGKRYLAVTYSPIFIDGAGPAGAALVVTRDLTEYMQATEGLLQAQAALAHVNRVTTLGILTASIAHEVNQPLAAVVTDASAGLRWLKVDPPNLTETRETLVRIVRNGNRAADVIGRIRAMARRSPLQMDRLDINEVIREVIALTRREIERNDIILRTELDYSIPRVVGDKVQLQQVVLNLIMNAIEAMRDSDRRELKVKSQADGTRNVVVSVADAGPGLDAGSRDRIFDAFYTTKTSGTGMGLAISRSIVEGHGGRIWTTANELRGAVFHFVIPGEQLAQGDAEYRQIKPATP
jgi:PAS domain S-box-containing protein